MDGCTCQRFDRDIVPVDEMLPGHRSVMKHVVHGDAGRLPMQTAEVSKASAESKLPLQVGLLAGGLEMKRLQMRRHWLAFM